VSRRSSELIVGDTSPGSSDAVSAAVSIHAKDSYRPFAREFAVSLGRIHVTPRRAGL